MRPLDAGKVVAAIGGFLGISLLILFVATRLGRSDPDAGDAGLSSSNLRDDAASALASPGLDSSRPAPTQPLPERRTATQVLEAFWGPDWPLVKARLAEAGKDVEDREPPSQTWPEAAAEIEKRLPMTEEQRDEYRKNLLRWSGTVDRDWMLQQFGHVFDLDLTQLSRVQEIVERHHAGLDPMVDDFIRGLDRETWNAWYGGRFVHAPYTTTGVPGPERRGFFTKSDGQSGWAVSWVLTWEDAPDLKSLHDEIRALIRQRDLEVLKFAKGL